ncbi:MAG TPA: hypothetical protein VFK69_07415, partial [Candidatus Eisenbacteria bacterium]|nr:hypothetical protein [Candidatus Eisenbacteria bacterium]
MFRRCLPVLALLLAFAVPVRADEGDVAHVDAGTFHVSVAGREIGTETFTFDEQGDSLMVSADARMTLPARAANGEPVVLAKHMFTITGASDFGLRRYFSSQAIGPDTLLRGVEPQEGDTLFSVFRQLNGAGEGDRLVMPPGRLFVVDSPPLFTTFGLMCRALHGQSFDTRPVTLFVLGARDSLYDAIVTDLGRETIPWGGASVSARKLKLADASTEFLAWVSPSGTLLRFEQPSTGLKAERAAPPGRAPKRRAPPKRASAARHRA